MLPQIDSIFVFNWEKLDHEHLLVEHSKLIGIYDEFDLLSLSIQEQIDFLDQHLETFSFFDEDEYLTKDLSKQTADLLWFQFYHDVLFELTHNEEAKQEMIDACRSYYKDNIKESEMIRKFENEYQSKEALRWYLKKSFLYKIIKKALKIKDFNQLYIFRYFMKDLRETFIREHQKMIQSGKEILLIYRGIKLTNDQIEKFKENEGKLVSINGFFRTNIHRSTAFNQAIKPSKQTHLISVLLEIQCDLKQLNNNIIAIDSVDFSEFSSEEQQEIFFDSNVTFRLKSMRMEEDMWFIEMIASNQGEIIKEKYIKDSHRQMEGLSMRILFGRLMCDMGQWNQSQQFFEHLLNNSNSNNEDIGKIEYSLGEVLQWKGEWSEARRYYDLAYERMMNIKPIRLKDSADILFNIEICRNMRKTSWLQTGEVNPGSNMLIVAILRSFGKIFDKQAKYDEALIFHQQALTMLEEYYQSPHIDIAVSLKYIGSILIHQKNYDKALDFCQRAISIYTRYYPNGHVYIASTLNYIGYILCFKGNYDEALKMYERALSMQQKYYPSGHVDIAFSLNEIGHVHYAQGKYNEALSYYEQVLEILQKYCFSGHDNIICTLNNIGYIKKKQGKYDEAVDFHQQALTMQEKFYPSYYANIANTLNYISNVLHCQAKYDEALYYCQRALTMQESYYPSGNVSTASSLNNIGNILCDQGKYNEAVDFLRQALSTVEKHSSHDHFSITFYMNNIGIILCKQEKYHEALDYHRRTLDMQEKYCPSCECEITNTLNYIGNVLIGQEKYDE
ncbi:unnamed protein product, partial [Rotaria sordida]